MHVATILGKRVTVKVLDNLQFSTEYRHGSWLLSCFCVRENNNQLRHKNFGLKHCCYGHTR